MTDITRALFNKDKSYSELKYIVIKPESSSCHLVSNELISEQRQREISDMISAVTGYQVCKVESLSLLKEIQLIWPQIVEEFKCKFPSVNGWLARAELIMKDDKKLLIKVESKIAWKQISGNNMSSYLEKILQTYLGTELEVVIENGDFLEEIPETNFKLKMPEAIKSIPKTRPVNNDQVDDVIYGREITEEPTHQLDEIETELGDVILQGEVFNVDKIETRRGNTFYVISITDNRNSIKIKLFPNKELNSKISEGNWIKVSGYIQFDSYDKELTLMARDICNAQPVTRMDMAEEKRVELHLHTQMSAMDSVVEVDKVIKRAADWGHKAIAITDHGVAHAFPDAYHAGKKHGIKILYGIEAYLVDDGELIIINPCEASIDEAVYTVFDLETTGLNKTKDEIIEIGAVKIKSGEIIDKYNTFIKPGVKIPEFITNLTGITDNMVVDAPEITKVMTEFLEFAKDTVLVAHNASFDYGFLKSALSKIGKGNFYSPVLDTLSLSRALLAGIKNHKLNTICQHLNISLENHHRAVDDAGATAEVLLKLFDLMDNNIKKLEEINQLTNKIDWKNIPPYHLIILVKNKQGLNDLYRLVSTSHTQYFYRKPRILKSQLIHNRDNFILGSACEAGQLYRSILDNKDSSEINKIAKFYDFLEIQPLGNNEFLINKKVEAREDLMKINRQIYNLGHKFNKPVVATCDVHFLDPEDQIYRKILQAGQGYDKSEEQAPLYLRTTDEMLEEFNYLGEKAAREVVIENSVKIADGIEELKPIPDGLYTPKIDGAEDQIREMSYQRAHQFYGDKLPEIVEKRLEKELDSIIGNGFSVIYLIAHKLVKKSLEDRYLVGSRGSVGSSLVATMCQITEVNPLPPHYRCPECLNSEFIEDGSYGIGVDLPDKKCPECGNDYIKDGYSIPFEVFLGFEGDKVPDIDLNFSGEYQPEIHRHTEELFGRDYVFRAGTISTIAKRTAFGFVKGFMDDMGFNFNNAETNRLVKGCTGVRRTTGQHPGGMIVVPNDKEIYDFTPIQKPANDMKTDTLTTHFEFHAIHDNLLKLDLLGHDDPTSIRMLQDITGVSPFDIPLDDPQTMAIFSSTESLGLRPEDIGTTIGTLGIPEFGTSFVRQMLVDTKPNTFAELVRISGLSHGTDVWLNNAQDLIKNGTAKLAEVISVRDDIMNYLIQQGLEPGRAFWIMENVRKGKGLKAEEEEYMRENNVPEWYIDSCNKIKYMFPKAHAAAYVMMAFRIAYFKVHHPEAFYATYFTTKAADFDAFLICQGKDEILRYKKELDEKGNNLTAKEKNVYTILEIVIEAMVRGIKFTNVDLYESDIQRFIITEKGLLPPLVSLEGLGSSAAANIAATREEGEFSSIEDLVNRTKISKTVVEVMQNHGTLHGLPEKNQLSLF